jgi:hypothetical protein
MTAQPRGQILRREGEVWTVVACIGALILAFLFMLDRAVRTVDEAHDQEPCRDAVIDFARTGVRRSDCDGSGVLVVESGVPVCRCPGGAP